MTGSLREQQKQLLVIANRVRRNTIMFSKLNGFLNDLGLPRVTYTRDSQLYTRAAAQGMAIWDLQGAHVEKEKAHWARIGGWIEHQLRLRPTQRQQAAAGRPD